MEKEIIINDSSLANALRRTMISQVPTYTIDTVTIKENDSNLPDEMIAHRLGQIPLIVDENIDEDMGNSIVLEATGPCKVYSGDIIFKNDKVRAVNPGILLLELGKEQCINLSGEIQMGIGEDHVKWSPAIIEYKKLKEGRFKLKIESRGSLSPNEILIKAIEIIRNKVVKFKKQL